MKRSHEKIERALVNAFLDGTHLPGSALASERELAEKYSVSRATVREALQQLEASGWILRQQRHATIVNDFWSRGNLEILASIEKNSESFPLDLAVHILELRMQFAPDYARKAVENNSAHIAEFLCRSKRLSDSATAIARYDWDLHLTMAVLSGNRIYPLIMNSSQHLYGRLRKQLFAREEIRKLTREYYLKLLEAAQAGDGENSERITRRAMTERLSIFRRYIDEGGESPEAAEV